jgi:hypothetical protein
MAAVSAPPDKAIVREKQQPHDANLGRHAGPRPASAPSPRRSSFVPPCSQPPRDTHRLTSAHLSPASGQGRRQGQARERRVAQRCGPARLAQVPGSRCRVSTQGHCRRDPRGRYRREGGNCAHASVALAMVRRTEGGAFHSTFCAALRVGGRGKTPFLAAMCWSPSSVVAHPPRAESMMWQLISAFWGAGNASGQGVSSSWRRHQGHHRDKDCAAGLVPVDHGHSTEPGEETVSLSLSLSLSLPPSLPPSLSLTHLLSLSLSLSRSISISISHCKFHLLVSR